MTMPPGKKQGNLAGQWGAFKRKAKNFGSAFLFEMFIEEFYPRFIVEMRKALSLLTPKDVIQMIETNEYPELPPDLYRKLQDYGDYLEKITVQRLWKAMVEACPDLALAIDSKEDKGYQWFARFRFRILQGIKAGGAVRAHGEQGIPMVGLTCDNCHQTLTVRADQAATIKECPFCHTPAGGSSPNDPSPNPDS